MYGGSWMYNLINTKINEIYNEFSEEIDKLDELCSLHHLDLTEKRIPNYQDKLNQQLYLLRNYPAYLFEYYRMYRKLYKFDFIQEPYKILSIGAGNGIDYSAIQLVLRDYSTNKKLEYISMDNIYWNYRTPIDPKHGRYITGDIASIEKLNRNDYNIFIFPKSISKFNKQQFKNIIDCFVNTELISKRLVFLSSVEDTENNLAHDIARLGDLVNEICEVHHYKNMNQIEQYFYFSDKFYGIKAVDDRFNYPIDVLRCVSNLHGRCNNFNKDMYRCNYDCKHSLNRTPILTLHHIRYQIICLEKIMH